MPITRKELIADLKAQGIAVTADGKVAKADLQRVLGADKDLLMTAEEYKKVLEHLKKVYDGFDTLKTYLLSLLSKDGSNKEKDKVIHEMVDAVVKQYQALENFHQNFNK
jgi:oligoendopeptidase F